MLNIAIKLAETSVCRQRHGAVIVRGGSVLGMGVNHRKNNPLIIENGKHVTSCGDHAEISSIKRTANTKGATIYIARVSREGSPVLSKPCKNCQQAIDNAQIKRVVYTV